MKKKNILFLCVMLTLIFAVTLVAFKQRPVSLDYIMVDTASRVANPQKEIGKKPCHCCEDRVEKIKEAMQEIRKAKQSAGRR